MSRKESKHIHIQAGIMMNRINCMLRPLCSWSLQFLTMAVVANSNCQLMTFKKQPTVGKPPLPSYFFVLMGVNSVSITFTAYTLLRNIEMLYKLSVGIVKSLNQREKSLPTNKRSKRKREKALRDYRPDRYMVLRPLAVEVGNFF